MVPTTAPGWTTLRGTVLTPAGLRARHSRGLWVAAVTSQGGHTWQCHCHSTQGSVTAHAALRPRPPPPRAPGGQETTPGVGRPQLPCELRGKGTQPPQPPQGRWRRGEGSSRLRAPRETGFLHRSEVLDFLWDRAWAGYEPCACTLQPFLFYSSFTGIMHGITLFIRSVMR